MTRTMWGLGKMREGMVKETLTDDTEEEE